MPRPTAASLSALLLVSLFTALLAPFWISQTASASPDLPPDLFLTPIAPAQRSTLPAGIAAVRSRPVEINPAALSAANAAKERPFLVNLALFSDVVYTAQMNARQATQTGGYILTGKLVDMPDSSVILSVQDSALSGSVTLLEGNTPVKYEITPAGALHRIEQINQSAYPAELDTLPPEVSSLTNPVSTAVALEDGSEVDVMVVYDAAARQQMGGTSGALSTINRAIAESNQGFANSGVVQRFNLVHTAEVNYTEVNSGSGFDWGIGLNQLTHPDGVIDEVLSWRDSYAADLTVMLVANSSYCGLAWVMTHPSVSFAPNAFSLVSVACATGYYSFAHELGHNMGSVHDPANSGMAGSYPYSYGYQEPNRAFRTIMAYNCKDGGCPRINHWSNPSVFYGGRSTGVANLSDNTRSLNNSAQYVANFRVRKPPLPPAALTYQNPQETQLPLTWVDNSWNEQNFKVWRKDGSQDYQVVALLPANTTSYNDLTVFCQSGYSYKVTASNLAGDSPDSNIVSTTTPACSAPSAPLGLAAAPLSAHQIRVSWIDSPNESYYKVFRSTSVDGPFVQVGANLPGNTTFYLDSDVEKEKIYYYQVIAGNTLGESVYSNLVSTTLPGNEVFLPYHRK